MGLSFEFCDKDVPPIRENPFSLRGRRLQAITKIADYEFSLGQTCEGIWDVEGMSHKEIVAKAVTFVERDPDILGGDNLFKRAFHRAEANCLHSCVS